MDPKTNSNQPLDPKLQEVYDKVMGTPTNAPAGQNPQSDAPLPNPPADVNTPAPTAPIDANTSPVVLPSDPTIPTVPPMPAPLVDNPTTPAEPTTPPTTDPAPVADESPAVLPANPMPAQPPVMPPTMPPVVEPPATPSPTDNPTQPTPMPPVPPTPPTSPVEPANPTPVASSDNMNATIAMPQIVHQDTETIKIGSGGSPVAAAVKTHKGISPLVLIFGAFAFLVVYAVFWVKFFGYSLPFLPQ